jgi:deoxyribodipyrimidine photo-lyase
MGVLWSLDAALLAKKSAYNAEFLEELIVRKELSDNFCYYNKNYLDFKTAAPSWAYTTLAEHAADKRDYTYTFAQLDAAKTHSTAWNVAQTELATTNRMHGYMRMFWAKKILEWSPSAESAYKIAHILNDKYELDGYDPNGYVGCLWSIGGLHDRAWGERKIFGKIRYMSEDSLKKKVSFDAYEKRVVAKK